MSLFKRIAQRAKAIRRTIDAGMTTAEYAVGRRGVRNSSRTYKIVRIAWYQW
jgi:hypothetical protein